MIASSGTVISNLAYLIGAVVLAVLGGIAVTLRHRKPKSVDANVASFRKGLSALAPDAPAGHWPAGVRPLPGGRSGVRVERSHPETATGTDGMRGGPVEESGRQVRGESG